VGSRPRSCYHAADLLCVCSKVHPSLAPSATASNSVLMSFMCLYIVVHRVDLHNVLLDACRRNDGRGTDTGCRKCAVHRWAELIDRTWTRAREGGYCKKDTLKIQGCRRIPEEWRPRARRS
jgi:hypothetical protein